MNELTDWSMKREGQNYLLTIGPLSNKKQSIILLVLDLISKCLFNREVVFLFGVSFQDS